MLLNVLLEISLVGDIMFLFVLIVVTIGVFGGLLYLGVVSGKISIEPKGNSNESEETEDVNLFESEDREFSVRFQYGKKKDLLLLHVSFPVCFVTEIIEGQAHYSNYVYPGIEVHPKSSRSVYPIGTEWVSALFNKINGISEVNVEPYLLEIKKSGACTWEELQPKLTEFFLTLMQRKKNPMEEEKK